MNNSREKIEAGFEALGRLVIRCRFLVVVLMLALTAVLTAQVPRLEMDTSTEGFLRKDDPALAAYNEFRDQFGSDEIILIAVEPPDVFTEEFLLKLKAFHTDLEAEVPYLDEVTSLVNARNTRGEGDELIVGDLLEGWPDKPCDLSELQARVMSNPNYRHLLVSEDGRLTTVLVRTRADAAGGEVDVFGDFDEEPRAAGDAGPHLNADQIGEVVSAVYRVVERYQAPDFMLHTAGSLVVDHTKAQVIKHDAPLFMRLSLLVTALCLLVLFRRFWGMALPLLTVFMSLLSTLGLMAICGVSFKLPTAILPAFLIAVGVGYSVHILAIFYKQLNTCGDRREAIVHSLGHSGLAVVVTCLTTVAGMSSFVWTDMAPVAEVGVFASVGVTLAMLYSLLFLPAMLAILPQKTQKPRKLAECFERLSCAIGDFSVAHAVQILAVTAVLAAGALWGASQLQFSMNVLQWFPEDMQVRKDTEYIDRELNGSLTLEMVVDTGRENGLYDPELLRRLDALAAGMERDYARASPEGFFVGKVISVVDVLKEINKALNENGAEYYAVPASAALIPQEFLLFENSGSDDLEDFVDAQFSKARFTIKVPYIDAASYGVFLHDVEERFRTGLGPEVTVTSTGIVAIFNRIIAATIDSLTRSYGTAIVVVTLLMILLIGEWRLGLASMVPNLLPILFCLGFMGFAGIPMDNANVMIGSVVLGIVVDDTIHFMHGFRRYYRREGNCEAALRATFVTTGRAMLFTTIILSLSFYAYLPATLKNYVNFGLLTGSTIIVALLANFILTPALVSIITRREEKRHPESSLLEERKCA